MMICIHYMPNRRKSPEQDRTEDLHSLHSILPNVEKQNEDTPFGVSSQCFWGKSRPYRARKVASTAATVVSSSCWVWASETNMASNWAGAR